MEGLRSTVPLMPDFSATLGAYMRVYPNLYPEPRDAMVHLMTTPGQWQEGCWIPEDPVDFGARMDYSDLVGHQHDSEADKLEFRAIRFMRRFMDEHMDTIASDPTRVFYRADHLRDYTLMKLIKGDGNWADHPFLVFPRDIKADWGKAISNFQDWLQQQQRYALGFNDRNGDVPSDWPVEARALYHSIESARRELFPLINGGADYDAHLEERRAFSSRLIGDLMKVMKDEKNEDAPVLIKRKPSP